MMHDYIYKWITFDADFCPILEEVPQVCKNTNNG